MVIMSKLAPEMNAGVNYSGRDYTGIKVTKQFADKPTRSQSSRGLVNSQTSQLAEMFDFKFAVYYRSKFDFG